MAVGLALLSAGATVTRGEGWFKKHWNAFKRDAQRNNAWPEPFIPGDRMAVRQPFIIQAANGWKVQNTLSDYHFVGDTGELNEAGRLKVKTILTETPPEFRTIYVLRSHDPQETADRIASVYELGNAILPPGFDPQVGSTDLKPRTTPSYYVDAVDRSYRASTPIPRIGASSGSIGTGMGSGGPPGGAGS
jgi:hypothetical protein